MKPIPSPEQRLEVSGKYRSHHKKAGASIIYIVSSLAIYVWGPKVMMSWLRCYKQGQIHGPETPWRLARRLPGSRDNSRMKLREWEVAELGARTLERYFPFASPFHLSLLRRNW